MAGGGRARAEQYAERVNAAVELLGLPVAEAARVLAPRFGLSERQARRYVEQAAVGGRVLVPAASTVFTVRLPGLLASRVRQHAAGSGRTISAVVAQALQEFLDRHRGGRPRR